MSAQDLPDSDKTLSRGEIIGGIAGLFLVMPFVILALMGVVFLWRLIFSILFGWSLP